MKDTRAILSLKQNTTEMQQLYFKVCHLSPHVAANFAQLPLQLLQFRIHAYLPNLLVRLKLHRSGSCVTY